MTWYREEVPHYPLAALDDPQAPVPQAFTVGRVRFILWDLRSARTASTDPNDENKTMLSEVELAWFKSEVLEAHKTPALII